MKVSLSYQGRIRTKLDHHFADFGKKLQMIEYDRFFNTIKGVRVMVFEATKETLELLEE